MPVNYVLLLETSTSFFILFSSLTELILESAVFNDIDDGL
jgi:hypothetical protein